MFAKAWPDLRYGPEEPAKTSRWVEQRKRCCSICPEHHTERVSLLGMTTWPCVLWAGAKRDRGGGKHWGKNGDLRFQIRFRTVWLTFPVCTSRCTHTHFQSDKLSLFFPSETHWCRNTSLKMLFFTPLLFRLGWIILVPYLEPYFPGKCSVWDTLPSRRVGAAVREEREWLTGQLLFSV